MHSYGNKGQTIFGLIRHYALQNRQLPLFLACNVIAQQVIEKSTVFGVAIIQTIAFRFESRI